VLAVDAAGLRVTNFELFTNRANCSLFDFSMAGDTCDLALYGVQPYGVPATLTIKLATLSSQVALQVDSLHASASSMVSRTASGERFFSANSRWHSKTNFSASRRLALASSSVSPCEIAAGISSTKQVYPPSFAGSKTAVIFIRGRLPYAGFLANPYLRCASDPRLPAADGRDSRLVMSRVTSVEGRGWKAGA